jgi:hypothetical protein
MKDITLKLKMCYSCIYLTCILYCFNKLNLNFLLLEKMGCMAYLVVQGIQEKSVYYGCFLTYAVLTGLRGNIVNVTLSDNLN